jgi:hypothetical protein
MILNFQEAESEKHGYPVHLVFNVNGTGLNILQSEFPQVTWHKARVT